MTFMFSPNNAYVWRRCIWNNWFIPVGTGNSWLAGIGRYTFAGIPLEDPPCYSPVDLHYRSTADKN